MTSVAFSGKHRDASVPQKPVSGTGWLQKVLLYRWSTLSGTGHVGKETGASQIHSTHLHGIPSRTAAALECNTL